MKNPTEINGFLGIKGNVTRDYEIKVSSQSSTKEN